MNEMKMYEYIFYFDLNSIKLQVEYDMVRESPNKSRSFELIFLFFFISIFFIIPNVFELFFLLFIFKGFSHSDHLETFRPFRSLIYQFYFNILGQNYLRLFLV